MDGNMPAIILPDTPENTAGSLIAYAVVCFTVVVVVVCLRFYVRLRLLRKSGIDDIALAITLVRAPIVLSRVNYAKEGTLTPVSSSPPSQLSL